MQKQIIQCEQNSSQNSGAHKFCKYHTPPILQISYSTYPTNPYSKYVKIIKRKYSQKCIQNGITTRVPNGYFSLPTNQETLRPTLLNVGTRTDHWLERKHGRFQVCRYHTSPLWPYFGVPNRNRSNPHPSSERQIKRS